MPKELEQLSFIFEQEAKWLSLIIRQRLKMFSNRQNKSVESIFTIQLNNFEGVHTSYTNFIVAHQLCFEERLLLALTLVPHIKPYLLIEEFKEYGFGDSNGRHPVIRDYVKEFPEMGLFPNHANNILPTGLTFLFLVAGRNLEQRFKAMLFLQDNAVLIREKVIQLDESETDSLFYSGKLIFSKAYFKLFTSAQDINLKTISDAN